MIFPSAAVRALAHNDSLRNANIGTHSAANTFLFVYFNRSTVILGLGYCFGKPQRDRFMEEIFCKYLENSHRIPSGNQGDTAQHCNDKGQDGHAYTPLQIKIDCLRYLKTRRGRPYHRNHDYQYE